MDKIDGIVQIAWREKMDLHGTTGGVLGSSSERYTFMAQVNRRLDLAVSRALGNGVPRIHDDCVRLSVPVKDHQKRAKQGRVRKRRSGGPLKEKKKFEWADDESVI